ncbi:BgTH12-01420 [Blumeria graminis f. sp. triticale]|uniref:BgTH12-01420 n=1 Tax=Blumeria graminis f. sp. triticale TaxID=1689686 RepID=A0A9W4DFG8_BLUGR|nr:BgTH12-06524 [Blumeria graminis f. sp. triticale]CAD6501166.1 BgTH12-01420 [Blumeria graminis f. sp. triticale]
MRNPCINRRRG